MYLRKLLQKDAPLMLEWMHDEGCVEYLRGDFFSKTINDCQAFIDSSISETSIHLAIVSDSDEYMGTVSLKNIENDSAEFAIVVRKKAMGLGYAWYGMKSILDKAFNELSLNSVYWCVACDNRRAISFYQKHNYLETNDVPKEVLSRYSGINNLQWYSAFKSVRNDNQRIVAGCKVIQIKTMRTLNSGELSVFEAMREVPFVIKRIYYITGVPKGAIRGFHAHKELKQLLFCPYGRILLILENKDGRAEIELSDPSVGVVIEKCTWREILWLQKDSVLCVAASDYYKTDDYIREHDKFLKYIEKWDNSFCSVT